MDSLFFFSFFFFFNDGTTGIGEENCASLHVSKNRDNFQVSWTWTHSVKFPAVKKVISDCAISKKKKKRKKAALVGFIHVSSLTTGSPLQKQQEKVKSQQLKQVCISNILVSPHQQTVLQSNSLLVWWDNNISNEYPERTYSESSLHLAWPPKFKNQVLFTPRAQSRFLDLGLLLRGFRPKSGSLPGRVEVIQPVVRACTTFWLTSTRITLTRVHRPRPEKTSRRFVLGICVTNALSPDAHWEVWLMGQEGCRVYHCCRHTMVSKLKLDHNEVLRAFVQKYRRSVLPKSLRTHPDHTPHVYLSSLFVHSHK